MLHAAYLTLALQDEHMKAFGVSLNLGNAERLKALKAKRGPLDYLRREIIRHVEAILGRKVRFWLAIETIDPQARDLHIHGAISLHPSEQEAVAQTLKKFSTYGIGTQARGRVLDMGELSDPLEQRGPAQTPEEHHQRLMSQSWRWGTYVLKDTHQTARITNRQPLTEDKALRKQAEVLYEQHRRIMREYVTNMRVR